MDTFTRHSREDGYRLGNQSGYNPGNPARHSTASEATRTGCERIREGLTDCTGCATLRSIEQTKARHSTKHESRTGCETISEAQRETREGLRGARQKRQMPRAPAQTHKATRTAARHSASRTDAAQTAQAARVASAARMPHDARGRERPRSAARGTHGGSGQRVGSEGVSHERTKFRCT